MRYVVELASEGAIYGPFEGKGDEPPKAVNEFVEQHLPHVAVRVLELRDPSDAPTR